MEANDYQIGGSHYEKFKYQHWDFICDAKLHYLLGNAIKYLRWRDKDGIDDLRKCCHYLAKAEERGVYPPNLDRFESHLKRFSNQFEHDADRNLALLICMGNYDGARNLIARMVTEHTLPNTIVTTLKIEKLPSDSADKQLDFFKG